MKDFVKACLICNEVKPLNRPTQGLFQPLPIPGKIWDSISIDFIVGLPSSEGKTDIMVVVDRVSKYAHFVTLSPNFTTSKVAEVFAREICRLHGFPSSIVSNRDHIFMSMFWRELFKLQQTKLSASSAYHPQSDGQTEVVNRCLETYLRSFTADSPTAWAKYLHWAEWHYNTS